MMMPCCQRQLRGTLYPVHTTATRMERATRLITSSARVDMYFFVVAVGVVDVATTCHLPFVPAGCYGLQRRAKPRWLKFSRA
jgi:hypothetical protein